MATKFFILIILICGVFPGSAHAANWYVDNAATGANNGTSWTNAWQSFAAIGWTQIQPGDTVYISGGVTSQTYNERLSLKKSFEYNSPDGTAENPITIQVGQDAGHNGIVIITGDTDVAVRFSNMAYYTLSGQVGSGSERHIKIINHNTHGILQDGNSNHINYEYLEISESGQDVTSGFINGIDIAFQSSANVSGEIAYCDIHDVRNDPIAMGIVTPGKALGYGMMKIHDNLIRNIHEDPIMGTVGGVDIYNNNIGPRILPHRGHPDTKLMNSYYRVYNNYFHDWYIEGAGNDNGYLAFLYWEPDGDGWNDSIKVNEGYPSNFMVYNNVFNDATEVPNDVDLNNWGIMLGIGDPTFKKTSDVYIFNNYFQGDLDVLTISFGNSPLSKENVTNFKILNNIFWNAGRPKGGCTTPITFTIPTNPGTPVDYGSYNSGASIEFDYNIYTGQTEIGGYDYYGTPWGSYSNFKSMTGAQAHDFGSPNISVIGLDANFRPLAGSPVIDTALNLSTYFSIDKGGNLRPQGAGWDLGPYEYSASPPVNTPVHPAIHVFPIPYCPGSGVAYGSSQGITFANLPPKTVIKIYSIFGELVFKHEKDNADPQYVWKTVNSSGKQVASGVYIYQVFNPDNQAGKATGKLVIVR